VSLIGGGEENFPPLWLCSECACRGVSTYAIG